ncbi:MAG: serine hydrolase, partial [Actinomycetota bacterium]
YRFYGRSRLGPGLARVRLDGQGEVAYSNLGFVVLAVCLAAAAQTKFNDLLREAIFEPAGMASARCQPCSKKGLVRGRGAWMTGGRRWHEPLPGAGGIDCSITDLSRWLQVNLEPDLTSLHDAIRLYHEPRVEGPIGYVGLAWQIRGDIHWHNGGTGGFQSFLGFVPGRVGAALLSNSASREGAQFDRLAARWLKRSITGGDDCSPE